MTVVPRFTDLKRLHNEELHSFYHSPNIVRTIKSRRLRWARDLTRMVLVIMKYKYFQVFKIILCSEKSARKDEKTLYCPRKISVVR